MRLRLRGPSALAWWVATPLLALAGAGIVAPFAWRSVAALAGCWQDGGCADVLQPYYLDALLNTLGLSTLSTLLALPPALGLCALLAPRTRLHGPAAWLANLGANFAGVPLALAFTLLFGVQGVVTQLLGFAPLRLEGTSGLLAAYLCFQLPLATLLLLAPVALLDAQLEEAAATLGAGRVRYWRRVALPLLAPSLVEVAVLLFANAAAAFATPFALAGGSADVLAVRLSSLVSGDLFADPRLPALLALMLFGLLALALLAGRWLGRRLARAAA